MGEGWQLCECEEKNGQKGYKERHHVTIVCVWIEIHIWEMTIYSHHSYNI